MRRDDVGLWSPAIGAEGRVIAYGHWGRPLLVLPSQEGRRTDFEDRGMLDAVRGLVDAGRVKIYCVDSFDSGSWMRDDLPMEERARRHDAYEDWILQEVLGFIDDDCNGAQDVLATGCSFGAYHAANLVLRHAERFPAAICMSGVYSIADVGWGDRGDAVYFNNPVDYVANMNGGHLDWLRSRASLLLVCGQGQWEDTTGSLESTKQFGGILRDKGIRCEVDLWGYDVPHDWPSWRRQLAHHLPRFC
jgi:esterase/lipase superfamily enzyme